MTDRLETVCVADSGTVIRKTVEEDGAAVDLSAATGRTFVFTGPSGQRNTLSASFVTDGTDGQLTASSEAGTWDEAGEWEEQVQIVSPGGSWCTLVQKRLVAKKL